MGPPPLNMVAETRHVLEEVGFEHRLPAHGTHASLP